MGGRTIPFKCHDCGKEMQVPVRYAETSQTCRECGKIFVVPEAAPKGQITETNPPSDVQRPTSSTHPENWLRKAANVLLIGLAGLASMFMLAFIMEPSLRTEIRHQLGLKPSQGSQRPAKKGYTVLMTESYSAWVGGRFENGAKLHVLLQEDSGWLTGAAMDVAGRRSERAVTVFFWNSRDDVGRTAAVYGVELIDGSIREVLIDQR